MGLSMSEKGIMSTRIAWRGMVKDMEVWFRRGVRREGEV